MAEHPAASIWASGWEFTFFRFEWRTTLTPHSSQERNRRPPAPKSPPPKEKHKQPRLLLHKTLGSPSGFDPSCRLIENSRRPDAPRASVPRPATAALSGIKSSGYTRLIRRTQYIHALQVTRPARHGRCRNTIRPQHRRSSQHPRRNAIAAPHQQTPGEPLTPRRPGDAVAVVLIRRRPHTARAPTSHIELSQKRLQAGRIEETVRLLDRPPPTQKTHLLHNNITMTPLSIALLTVPTPPTQRQLNSWQRLRPPPVLT